MRAVIIGNGEIKNYEYIKSKISRDDYIICADGGYNHALNMGIKPDIVIGDFDSAEKIDSAENVIKYPVRKNYTDGELAVDYAVKKGYEDIMLIAMTGSRLDHTISDILLLGYCKNGVLVDDNNEIYLVRDIAEITGRKGQTVSIIPIGSDAEGVTTEGLEYPLKNETLYFGKSRGVSNVMTDDKCGISLKKGAVLVIKVENI